MIIIRAIGPQMYLVHEKGEFFTRRRNQLSQNEMNSFHNRTNEDIPKGMVRTWIHFDEKGSRFRSVSNLTRCGPPLNTSMNFARECLPTLLSRVFLNDKERNLVWYEVTFPNDVSLWKNDREIYPEVDVARDLLETIAQIPLPVAEYREFPRPVPKNPKKRGRGTPVTRGPLVSQRDTTQSIIHENDDPLRCLDEKRELGTELPPPAPKIRRKRAGLTQEIKTLQSNLSQCREEKMELETLVESLQQRTPKRVLLKNREGQLIPFTKSPRKQEGEAARMERLKKVALELEEKKVNITSRSLSSLGFGSRIVNKFLKETRGIVHSREPLPMPLPFGDMKPHLDLFPEKEIYEDGKKDDYKDKGSRSSKPEVRAEVLAAFGQRGTTGNFCFLEGKDCGTLKHIEQTWDKSGFPQRIDIPNYIGDTVLHIRRYAKKKRLHNFVRVHQMSDIDFLKQVPQEIQYQGIWIDRCGSNMPENHDWEELFKTILNRQLLWNHSVLAVTFCTRSQRKNPDSKRKENGRDRMNLTFDRALKAQNGFEQRRKFWKYEPNGMPGGHSYESMCTMWWGLSTKEQRHEIVIE